jgi:alpha 1,2-mannosyltransferase
MTPTRGDTTWLQQYYSRINGRSAPQDRPLDSLKPRVRAVILVLCRNSDLGQMMTTCENFERRWNKKYKYSYVFLNNEAWEGNFIKKISKIISNGSGADVSFGIVPKEHWSYPEWIDQEKASKLRRQMGERGIAYGGSESYRFMCRYFSGFFYRHPLLQDYDYYWRVEPGVEFTCDINYDVFRFMHNHDKKYGFVITMQEIPETIPTLWPTIVEDFLSKRLCLSTSNLPAIRYFGPPTPRGYNGCHFWSNFEIASFDFFRSHEYQNYFEVLDRKGGFFYERWGDAPVHSIAVGLFLPKEAVHYFHDIGYKHHPFSHCPADFMSRKQCNCDCDPFERSEISHGMCQTLWNVHYVV